MTLRRVQSAAILEKARDLLPKDVVGFDPEGLSSEERNITLERDGDIGLFEHVYDGVYEGHYLFRNAKGGDALALAQEMLDFVFREGAEVIRGLTPLDNKPALYVTAKLGFTNYGDIETEVGTMRLSLLTKKDFYK